MFDQSGDFKENFIFDTRLHSIPIGAPIMSSVPHKIFPFAHDYIIHPNYNFFALPDILISFFPGGKSLTYLLWG